MKKDRNDRIVSRLSRVGIFGNLLLTAFKLLAGILGSSAAMVSDAVHSLSDVLATLIALIGVRLSRRSADRRHPYGHERFECVASLLLSCILAVTGAGIGWSGLQKIITGSWRQAAVPGLLPLIAAAVSIAVKEAMYRYTMFYAKRMHSAAFQADAWHHRSDALSSVGSLAGIAAARLGLPICDPIAAAVIALFILKTAWTILRDALDRLLDTSCGDAFEQQLSDWICRQPGVRGLDLLHTRLFSSRVYVDAEIAVDGSLPLTAAHAIAEEVHTGLEHQFPSVKHVMIHVNPAA